MTDYIWWNMPGPREFVGRIRRRLVDGANCAVYLPEHAPGGLKAAIRAAVEESGILWTPLTVDREDNPTSNPAEWLVGKFGGKFDPAGGSWVRQLHSMTSTFLPGVYCIQDIGAAEWPQWRKMLSTYSSLCTLKPPCDRPIFLCLLGPSCEDPFYREAPSAWIESGDVGHAATDDVAYASLAYRGVGSPKDMMAYALLRSRASSRRESGLDTDIRASIAAQVAIFDPEVCDALLEQDDLEAVIDPTAVLTGIAEERHWNLGDTPSWQKGSADSCGQRDETVHSAFAALQSIDRTVRQRVWKAQVSVLMPFLEEQKNQFLRAYHGRLHFEDPDDPPEIKDVRRMLIRQGVPRCDRNYLDKLRDARNSMAHLEPLTTTDFAQLRSAREGSSVVGD